MYIEMHGYDSLIPSRKHGICSELQQQVIALDDGAWTPTFRLSWRAFLATLGQTGLRKGDATTTGSVHTSLTRANLQWCIAGRILNDPTAEQLRSLAKGDAAILKCAPAKNDAFAKHFGPTPMWLPFIGDDPLCAARRLAELELHAPVHGTTRAQVALFVEGPDLTPLTPAKAQRVFEGLLRRLGPGHTDRYSLHSYRSALLASQLMAAGADLPTVQAMLRWKSPESAMIYMRINPDKYMEWLAKARSASVTSWQTAHLPRLDNDDAVAAFAAHYRLGPPSLRGGG